MDTYIDFDWIEYGFIKNKQTKCEKISYLMIKCIIIIFLIIIHTLNNSILIIIILIFVR